MVTGVPYVLGVAELRDELKAKKPGKITYTVTAAEFLARISRMGL